MLAPPLSKYFIVSLLQLKKTVTGII